MYKLLIAVLLLASCGTAKKIEKAKQTLLSHPGELAKLCSERFPSKEIIRVKIDSAQYNQTVGDLLNYSDSILQVADNRNRAIEELSEYIRNNPDQSEVVEALKEKLSSIENIDVQALRRSIEQEIKSKVRPCKDSIITKPDAAREFYLETQVAGLNNEVDDLAGKLNNKNKLIWSLLALCLACIVWITRKIWF